jgi:hypothetical protein
MKGMPCQVGDVAVVIGMPSHWRAEGLLGRWVRVVGTRPCPCCGDPIWNLEEPVHCVALVDWSWREVSIPAIADDYLQPIRGPRTPEAVPTTADGPHHVEA